MINGDRVRVQQTFGNLILNACRYTEPPGRIEVSLSTEKEYAVFRIRDTGVGITAEMMPRLFDMFAQADASTDRTRHGLGIGLALVRNLVRLHHGAISVASEGAGKGSEFTVRLPLSQTGQVELEVPAVHRQLETAMDGLRILVVDDNTDASESMRML